MRTDARVHYTVLTHHTNHNHKQTKNRSPTAMMVNEQHTSAARDTQQRANTQKKMIPTQPSENRMQTHKQKIITLQPTHPHTGA